MAKENTAKESKTTSRKRRKQTWFDVCLRAADRFMKNEMWRDAIEACNAIEKIIPGHNYVYYMRGLAYLNASMPEEALDDLTHSIQIDNTDPECYNRRGACYMMLGKHHQALSDFDEAISINGETARYYANRGLCYMEIEDNCRAIKDLDKAISLDTSHELEDIYYFRGEAHSRLGNYKLALEDYKQEIKNNPLNINAFASRMLVLEIMKGDISPK
ncbi:MAG: tetratricopeptide repeat protein [Dehalococcoidales bacterium]|jgi:tetratricopeptide (TPR) repeat protein|nr:tetratricopeptide repeat protein [Dehalococcoidales bacterium]MDX9803894.1 tetratricopeptide repeat protein [Dehalococcoidales bacterium]